MQFLEVATNNVEIINQVIKKTIESNVEWFIGKSFNLFKVYDNEEELGYLFDLNDNNIILVREDVTYYYSKEAESIIVVNNCLAKGYVLNASYASLTDIKSQTFYEIAKDHNSYYYTVENGKTKENIKYFLMSLDNPNYLGIQINGRLYVRVMLKTTIPVLLAASNSLGDFWEYYNYYRSRKIDETFIYAGVSNFLEDGRGVVSYPPLDCVSPIDIKLKYNLQIPREVRMIFEGKDNDIIWFKEVIKNIEELRQDIASNRKLELKID